MNNILINPRPNVTYIILKQVYNTEEECNELIQMLQKEYDRYMQSSTKFYLVFNTSHVNYVQPFLVKKFAAWMASMRSINEQYLVCSFMIITSPFARGCFNMILTLFTPSRPYYIKESIDEVNQHLSSIMRF